MPGTKFVRVANPILVRRFHVVDEPEREIVLTIGKPRPYADPSGDWMCSVLIDGIPKSKRRRIHGVDALQALQLSIEYARLTLDASGVVFTWLEGGEPGYTGISRIVPGGWGVAFERKIEQYMDRESQRFARAAIAKGRGAKNR
jgi:hypothetical protein